ncbi:arsenate reductase (glutaredoxin) [Deferribacter desulfuricans SSM1]|uniref:Arsenate reductase (Glutaredoxin) n=1 Tax=Deferribacter desulfuricans (strain DSM 14783 / JCM 11476 / NBRC 101012 / SSM1) TaxID=639282 RepID=D3PE89_DEFDS|nr:arsenate reductase (thioredoxin) [Deferribacter desulfuricans]BAI80912.1 arsenate reductase (glutaredoxin) [Deferribacter desulfuricans SSM1]
MKKKLLFLCTGNSCRSQMAEGYGKIFLGDKYEVYSAGIEKHGLNPNMVKVMKEDGVDVSNQYSKTLNDLVDIDFDVVVTVCGDAHETCPMYLKKAKIIHKGFKDPAKAKGTEEEILKVFREVRDQIKDYIKNELINLI